MCVWADDYVRPKRREFKGEFVTPCDTPNSPTSNANIIVFGYIRDIDINNNNWAVLLKTENQPHVLILI